MNHMEWSKVSSSLKIWFPQCSPFRVGVEIHTYLAGEIPWSRRWFTQGEAQPLHSGCADPCEFPKCGNLDCIISGSGGLRSRSPLIFWLKVRIVIIRNCTSLYRVNCLCEQLWISMFDCDKKQWIVEIDIRYGEKPKIQRSMDWKIICL